MPVTVRVVGGGDGPVRDAAQRHRRELVHGPARAACRDRVVAGLGVQLLRAAIDDTNPALFYEHKALYARKGPVDRGAIAEIGKAAVVRTGSDVTIVATLMMVERALAAAEQLAADGIEAEVIDLRWLRPLDLPTIRASVDKTGRLVIAEEQWHEAGWGATIISELTIAASPGPARPAAVSLPDDLLIPYSPPLEDEILPSADAIAAAARASVGR